MSNILGEENEKIGAFGLAATDASGILSPFHFTRRANGDNDITLDILYSGICHSDLHMLKNEYGMSIYPMVPGASLKDYCSKKIRTYNAHDHDGSVTYGGYSDKIVVNEHFSILMPKGLPLEGVAPLLCAGITVYSPMMHHGLCQPGQHLGVVGLGGLGHVAVKFAKAFNMKVSYKYLSWEEGGSIGKAWCRLILAHK